VETGFKNNNEYIDRTGCYSGYTALNIPRRKGGKDREEKL
jgi:hypothetical protein